MSRDSILCPEHALGTTLLNMQLLAYLGIPYPNNDPFDEFSVRNVRGDLGRRGDGYPSFVWEWVGMTYDQTYRLLEYFITFGEASARVYVKTRTNRVTGGSRFSTFLATLESPILSGTDGMNAGQGITAYSPFRVNFTGAIVQ